MPLLTKDQRGGKAVVKQSLTTPKPCQGCNKPQPTLDLSCIHRGDKTGERPCSTCSGKPIVFFSCALHEQCTLQKRVNQIKVCAKCADRQAE